MTRRPISQREARRLRRRVRELEQREAYRLWLYSQEYPGGVNVLSLNLSESSSNVLETCNRLKKPLVARFQGTTLRLFALED